MITIVYPHHLFIVAALFSSVLKNQAHAAAPKAKDSAVVRLNPDNFNELTKGKTVFIKFFSPSCGFCEELAPTWEKLARLWRNDTVGLIAEVDCTDKETGGEKLCMAHKVKGLPTLLHGDPLDKLEEYTGENEYNELWEFSKKHLVPICHALNVDACEGDMKENVKRFWGMSPTELDAEIENLEQGLKDVETRIREEVNEMTTFYEDLMREKELTVAKIKENITLMKGVKEQQR